MLGTKTKVNSLFIQGYFSARYSQVKDLAGKQVFKTGGNVLLLFAQSKSFTLFVSQNISDVLLNPKLLVNQMIAHEIEEKLKGQTPIEVQSVTSSIKNVQISATYPNLSTLDFLERIVFQFCDFVEVDSIEVAETSSDPAVKTNLSNLRKSLQSKTGQHFIPQCVFVRVHAPSSTKLHLLAKFQHKAQKNQGYVSAVFSHFSPRIESIVEWLNTAAVGMTSN